jgi:alpha-beta hydrolase superfamily lysophospholipase
VTLPPRDLIGVALSLLVSPRRHFRIPLEPEQYTENPRFRGFVAADQQRLLTASARFFFETARLDRQVAKAPPSIQVPVLLLCGGRDAIVDSAGLQAWYARLAAQDRTMKVYPEFAHILEFEDRRDEYLSDLLDWLQAHASDRSTGARPEAAEGRHADRPD